MYNLKKFCATALFFLSQTTCYTPSPRQQNSELITYYEKGYQTIEFIESKTSYKIDSFVYNVFEKRKHLIDPKYRQALQKVATIKKALDIIDSNKNKIISISEASTALISKEIQSQLEKLLTK